MSLLATIFDLVLPETCAGCGRPPELLCATCALPLQAAARRGPAPPGVPRPYYVAHYERPVKAVLAAYKEQGRAGLADPLGEALSTAISAALGHGAASGSRPPGGLPPVPPRAPPSAPPSAPSPAPPRAVAASLRPAQGIAARSGSRKLEPGSARERSGPGLHGAGADAGASGPVLSSRAPSKTRGGRAGPSRVLVVWVPSGREALRRRRRDVLGEMAEAAVRRLRAEGAAVTAGGVLRLRRRVADQAGLSAARRRANLRGAIEVRAPVAGHRVVLVDDVVTTGASLAEAARALREAGAEVVGAATVAMTPRRRG